MNKEQFLGASLHTGLKFDIKSDLYPYPTLVGIRKACLEFNYHGVYLSFQKDFVGVPVARPLSDLTKPIVHNGETFVPIVELAKMASLKLKWVVTFEDGQCYIGTDVYQKQYTFFYSISEQSFYINSIRDMKHTPYQFKLFQKLIEWHFNIMDESEPFIPVTEEFNPYK